MNNNYLLSTIIGLQRIMKKHTLFFTIFIISLTGILCNTVLAEDFENRTDFPPVGNTDPDAYIEVENYHGGAGSIYYTELLGWKDFETNFLFFRSGIVPPKSGIGEHIHNKAEVMYINLDGPARFTLDGYTSVLPARAMVLCSLGSSHGIYNHTDKDIRLLSIGVATERLTHDANETDNDIVGAKFETPPPFIWGLLDRSLLSESKNSHEGKGSIFARRIWLIDSFKTNWLFVTHALIPPGSSIGYHQHNTREEVYYVISGKGRLTANDHTFDVQTGDAVPCLLHCSHGIYNNSNDDLELLIFSVAVEKGIVKYEKNWGDDLTGR